MPHFSICSSEYSSDINTCPVSYTHLRTTGFGLGLTFVRKVVDTYGGDIQVESKVGVGSSFIVVLPQ